MISNLRLSLLLASASMLALVIAPQLTHAQSQERPELVYQNIEDGATIDEPASVIQLCFASPINIRDLFDGGDFSFSVVQPDGLALGHRDVFQVDGLGLAIHPGPSLAEGEELEGEWRFSYRVTSPDGEEALEGEFSYTVDPAGEPAPEDVRPCVGEAGTASPTPVGFTPSQGTFVPMTPGATGDTTSSGAASDETDGASPDSSGSATPTDGDGGDDDDDDPGILALSLLTIGAAGAVGVILLIGFLVRRRIGFEPHAPRGDGSEDDHH